MEIKPFFIYVYELFLFILSTIQYEVQIFTGTVDIKKMHRHKSQQRMIFCRTRDIERNRGGNHYKHPSFHWEKKPTSLTGYSMQNLCEENLNDKPFIQFSPQKYLWGQKLESHDEHKNPNGAVQKTKEKKNGTKKELDGELIDEEHNDQGTDEVKRDRC